MRVFDPFLSVQGLHVNVEYLNDIYFLSFGKGMSPVEPPSIQNSLLGLSRLHVVLRKVNHKLMFVSWLYTNLVLSPSLQV